MYTEQHLLTDDLIDKLDNEKIDYIEKRLTEEFGIRFKLNYEYGYTNFISDHIENTTNCIIADFDNDTYLDIFMFHFDHLAICLVNEDLDIIENLCY